MNLSIVEAEILAFEQAGAIDPDDLRRLRALTHPDLHPGEVTLATTLFQRLGHIGEPRKPVSNIVIGRYQLGPLAASGDFGDVFVGDQVIKVSRDHDGRIAMKQEGVILKELQTDSIYQHSVPRLIDQIALKGKVALVFEKRPLHTLEEIKTQHPRLSCRHVVWMFRRTMVALGYIHSCGYCHGAVTPDNVMFDASRHTGQLVGFTHSVKLGERLLHGSLPYLHHYPGRKIGSPGLDTAMAGYAFLHLLEGLDPPRRLERFIRSLTLAPADPFQLNDEMGKLAIDVYGEPVFLPLEMKD